MVYVLWMSEWKLKLLVWVMMYAWLMFERKLKLLALDVYLDVLEVALSMKRKEV